MSVECYPITVLPHISPLYRDFLAMADTSPDAPIRRWYGAEPFPSGSSTKGSSTKGNSTKSPAGSREAAHTPSNHWMLYGKQADKAPEHANALADLLDQQALTFQSSDAARANIAKLRTGARAIVTGQQVVLFGGPLLTFLKAATAIARAREASAATGIPHVPIFWMATEDHDLAEVDQVSLLTKTHVETLHVNLKVPRAIPVGGVTLGAEFNSILDHAAELLEYAPITDWLRGCYTPQQGETPTLALAFGRLIAKIFADQGLIVMDASTRAFHALGASTLRSAIEHAPELRRQLLARSHELIDAGYHAQVLVSEDSSLLFLLDETTNERIALKLNLSPETSPQADPTWKAGNRTYTSAELLTILDTAPERLSPNALLRPVFQDTLLPTAAYIGGPSEIAYFAQTSLLAHVLLGRVTPVLPRVSATLLEPAIASVMDKDEVQLPDAMSTPEALAQRLGARAMPIEVKRRLAAVGNALEPELAALTEYLSGIDPTLGRAAEVSGSKMHYQMNRLRRMAATFELQKEASLRKHAEAITLNVFPTGHPQERVIAGVWFLSRYGEPLIDRLIQTAANQCPGHLVIRL